jgi:hypothetical protein
VYIYIYIFLPLTGYYCGSCSDVRKFVNTSTILDERGYCVFLKSATAGEDDINLFGTGVLHLIQINHQPNATIFQFITLSFLYSPTCFGIFPVHHQELNDCRGCLWFYLRIVVIVVLCSWSDRPAGPTTNTARADPLDAVVRSSSDNVQALLN